MLDFLFITNPFNLHLKYISGYTFALNIYLFILEINHLSFLHCLLLCIIIVKRSVKMKHHKSTIITAMISHHNSLQPGPRFSICFGFLGILQLKSLAASIQTNQFLCQDPRRQRNIPISKIRHYAQPFSLCKIEGKK